MKNRAQTTAIILLMTLTLTLSTPPYTSHTGATPLTDERTPTTPYVITGHVYDTDGKTPLENATVIATVTDPQGVDQERVKTITGSGGNYTFSLAFYRSGDTVNVSATYGNLTGARYFLLKIPEEGPGEGAKVDIILHPPYRVYGTVRFSDGRPAAGWPVTITVSEYNGIKKHTYHTTTDENGRYSYNITYYREMDTVKITASGDRYKAAAEFNIRITGEEATPYEKKVDLTLRKETDLTPILIAAAGTICILFILFLYRRGEKREKEKKNGRHTIEPDMGRGRAM